MDQRPIKLNGAPPEILPDIPNPEKHQQAVEDLGHVILQAASNRGEAPGQIPGNRWAPDDSGYEKKSTLPAGLHKPTEIEARMFIDTVGPETKSMSLVTNTQNGTLRRKLEVKNGVAVEYSQPGSRLAKRPYIMSTRRVLAAARLARYKFGVKDEPKL